MLLSSAGRRSASNFPLQVFIYYHWWFLVFYVLVAFALFIYKSTKYPYPNSALELEIFMVLLYAVVESLRLATGMRRATPPLPRAAHRCLL